MEDKTRCLVASHLTNAFYAGIERRRPYLGEERRKIMDSPSQDYRIPTLSLSEVFHVYCRFLSMLNEAEGGDTQERKDSQGID